MKALRWLLIFCGTLLMLGALYFLAFLPESVREYTREPEDIWLQGGWALSFGLLSALSFWTAEKIRSKRQD